MGAKVHNERSMAIIVGQIEPLKKIKEALNEKGVTRFKSIGEINAFLRNYNSEINEIPKTIENDLIKEIEHLDTECIRTRRDYEEAKKAVTEDANQKISNFKNKLEELKGKNSKRNLFNIFNALRIKYLSKKISRLENSMDSIIRNGSAVAEFDAAMAKKKVDDFMLNRNSIIAKRCADSLKNLNYIKSVIEGISPMIAGALGENSVVKEVKKLSDEFYMINNFYVKFDPPIYNRSNRDRIFSIQIDHIVVCRSGIFSIETKNWSEKSINDLDLRSPVEQVLRSGYALFVLVHDGLKSDLFKLTKHHWGNKKIPIRNIIAMTNKKPKGEFKHVKILSLAELIGYIKYFEPIFSKEEADKIFMYLNGVKAS